MKFVIKKPIFLIIILFILIYTIWDYSHSKPADKVFRIERISIRGSFDYPIKFVGDKRAEQTYSLLSDYINPLHFEKGIKRELYDLKVNNFYIKIPILGNSNIIDFFIKTSSKSDLFTEMRVFFNSTPVSTFMISDEFEYISILIDDEQEYFKENYIVLNFDNGSHKLGYNENININKSDIIISDFAVKGFDPLPDKHRYNYQGWVADRVLMPNNTDMVFDISPQDNSFLFFTYCLYDLDPDISVPYDYIIEVDAYYGDNIKEQIYEDRDINPHQPMQKTIIPLQEAYTRIEIRYISENPGRMLAVGNIMMLPKIERDKKDDIFMICIDTLRRDHIGAYGYERHTSPHIDELAEDSVVFLNAISNSSWTLPSAFYHYFGQHSFEHDYQWGYNIRVPGSMLSAINIFQENDFITVGIFANLLISDSFGFSKGFDLFYENPEKKWMSASEISSEAIEMLSLFADFNIFINMWFFDPHDPYNPPGLFENRYIFQGGPEDYVEINYFHEEIAGGFNESDRALSIDTLIDQYDSSIQYADFYIGRFLDYARLLGVYEGSVIVLFSDHGEEFLEHGNLKHGYALYDESINIPLIFKFPGNAFKGLEMDHPVDLTDIFPTIWDIKGIERPENYRLGRNLRDQDYDRIMISLTASNSPMKVMLKKNNIKFIKFFKEYNNLYEFYFQENSPGKTLNQYIYDIHPAEMLFDISDDPLEMNNIHSLEKTKRYRDYYETLLKSLEGSLLSLYHKDSDDYDAESGKDRMDEEMIEALRALGYLN